jgi:hypothetical protein
MNRSFRFFIAMLCFAPLFSAGAAVQVKKAAPVAAKPSAGTESAASLVPTVLGLVSNVMEMNAKQKALTEECIPSSAEINFVNNTIKEWAKTGQTTAAEMGRGLGSPCGLNVSDGGYAADVLSSAGAAGSVPCYDTFVGAGNRDMVWENFPKASKGTYCKSGGSTPPCLNKNDLVTVSNAYDLFNRIDFSQADYTQGEVTMAGKLLSKVEDCSSSKLSAKKRALWAEFLFNTAGSLGQKTNTGTIMEQVGGIVNSNGGGALGSLGSLGAIATQFMNK